MVWIDLWWLMMEKYVFFDTDIDGNEEYDIRGEAYKTLIRTCCEHSAVLYLKYTQPNLPIADQLKKYEINKPSNIPNDTVIYGPYCERHYFKVCPELCEILLNATEGIFEWLNGWGFQNPDDPTFYREDGSVFFASEIHNGLCVLIPNNGENVEELLRAATWEIADETQRYPSLIW